MERHGKEWLGGRNSREGWEGLGGCFQLFHTQLRTHSGAGSPKAGCSLTAHKILWGAWGAQHLHIFNWINPLFTRFAHCSPHGFTNFVSPRILPLGTCVNTGLLVVVHGLGAVASVWKVFSEFSKHKKIKRKNKNNSLAMQIHQIQLFTEPPTSTQPYSAFGTDVLRFLLVISTPPGPWCWSCWSIMFTSNISNCKSRWKNMERTERTTEKTHIQVTLEEWCKRKGEC